MFLVPVPLDSSDIASPDGTVMFSLKSRFRGEFSIIRALAVVVFAESESRLSHEIDFIL
jgi:hypothetical protein